MATLLSVSDFAHRLGVSRVTVYTWAKKGWVVREGPDVVVEATEERLARYRDPSHPVIDNAKLKTPNPSAKPRGRPRTVAPLPPAALGPPPPPAGPHLPPAAPTPPPPLTPPGNPVSTPLPPPPARPSPSPPPPEPEEALQDGLVSTEEARRIKENYLALKGKLEYEKDSGSLIEIEAARGLFFEEFRALRNHWLGWPASCAARMAADLGVEADRMTEVLTKYVHQHTVAISDPDPRFKG